MPQPTSAAAMAAEPPVRVRTLATGNGRIGYLGHGRCGRWPSHWPQSDG